MQSTSFSQADDQKWMQLAIEQASLALYRTRPNPAVGCVIVKDHQVVGMGATAPVGGPHAEVTALLQAGEQAEGATVYVTLEPCAHYGRTPPCANALVKAKVGRVVMASLDPNPQVAGQGLAILNEAEIATEVGILKAQAVALNRGFLKVMAGGLPYVRLKMAASLDGRTAMASGESKWITGQRAREDVQVLRARSAAIVTGIETILADDSQLNVRALGQIDINQVVQPMRVVLDRQGRLPLDAKVLEHPESLIVMGPDRAELSARGVVQLAVQPLDKLLQTLAQDYQLYDVMVEAGATLATAFLEQALVDELICYVAPTFLGQSARAMFAASLIKMSQQQRFHLNEMIQLDQDIRLSLTPLYEKI